MRGWRQRSASRGGESRPTSAAARRRRDLVAPGRGGCRICVSIAAVDVPSAIETMQGAADADLVEIRLDAIAEAGLLSVEDLEALVRDAPVPAGFTCRRAEDGGGWRGSEAQRRGLLERAAAAGAAFVDVEMDADFAPELLASTPTPVIVSHHWDRRRPADLEERADRLAKLGPAIAKLVAPAERADDALPLIAAGRRLVEAGQPATAFCAGEAGRASRILVATYGGAVTYATLPGVPAVAPGQWTLAELVQELRLPRWSPSHGCCGLIGHPLGHSLSPAVFNAAFDAAGLPLGYLPLPSTDLAAALRVAAALRFRGLSVTMPFKEDAVRHCTELDRLAAAIGAANTLTAVEGGWRGSNTDASAVVEALAEAVELAGATVALVGAGGAARAAAVGLAEAGAAVTVLARRPQRAAAVAALIDGGSGPIGRLERDRFDVVVNATPVGMDGASPGPAATAFDPAWLSGDEVVLDMVYRPRRTALLESAAARGCATIDGLEMFLRQAAAQYRQWTGDRSDSPLVAMREAAAAHLGQD